MIYFIVGLGYFIAGFWLASVNKDSINIGFGNQNITTINGEWKNMPGHKNPPPPPNKNKIYTCTNCFSTNGVCHCPTKPWN